MSARWLLPLLLAACAGTAPRPRPAEPAAHRRCGWIATNDRAGVQAFVDHAGYFDAIHPKWYVLDARGITALPGADDPRVLAAARAHQVAVIPLIAGHDPVALRAVMRDPEHHVAALRALAAAHDYAGLDLDLEKLWGPDDRAGYQALLAEVAAALHADHRVLSAAVPGLADAKRGSPWDYAFLAAHLDQVHLMAYDLHSVGTHSGPVAPLGWVEAVVARVVATGHPERFLLGLPNYGVAPPHSDTSAGAAAECLAGYAVDDDHMASCRFGHWAAGRAPHCETARGTLHFDDLASLEAKVVVARAAGLGGITYWHLGGEPDGFFAMVARHTEAAP